MHGDAQPLPPKLNRYKDYDTTTYQGKKYKIYVSDTKYHPEEHPSPDPVIKIQAIDKNHTPSFTKKDETILKGLAEKYALKYCNEGPAMGTDIARHEETRMGASDMELYFSCHFSNP